MLWQWRRSYTGDQDPWCCRWSWSRAPLAVGPTLVLCGSGGNTNEIKTWFTRSSWNSKYFSQIVVKVRCKLTNIVHKTQYFCNYRYFVLTVITVLCMYLVKLIFCFFCLKNYMFNKLFWLLTLQQILSIYCRNKRIRYKRNSTIMCGSIVTTL